MRNKQNKHGPDVDIGVWYAALLRHSEAASGDSDAGRTARAGPMDCGTSSRKIVDSRVHAKTQRREDCLGFRISEIGGQTFVLRPYEGDWPPGSSISHKRRRSGLRSTIVNRRTGESPPGIVDDLITNYIDSIAKRKPSVGGRKVTGAQTTIWSVMGGLWPEKRDKGTRRDEDKETD